MLSDTEKKKVLQHLEASWQGNKSCPVCTHNQWHFGDSVFQLMEFVDGVALKVGGVVIPLIPLTCKTCGNTLLFNAIRLGAVSQSKKESEKENRDE